jgi:hypothetical protein
MFATSIASPGVYVNRPGLLVALGVLIIISLLLYAVVRKRDQLSEAELRRVPLHAEKCGALFGLTFAVSHPFARVAVYPDLLVVASCGWRCEMAVSEIRELELLQKFWPGVRVKPTSVYEDEVIVWTLHADRLMHTIETARRDFRLPPGVEPASLGRETDWVSRSTPIFPSSLNPRIPCRPIAARSLSTRNRAPSRPLDNHQ